MPILQARGLFRRDYEGSTLREHYGLPRPQSIVSAGAVPAARALHDLTSEGAFGGRRVTAPVSS